MNKKRISLIVFIIGIITLLAGVIFLIIRLNAGPSTADGEYLVSVGKWVKDGTECKTSDTELDIACDSNVVWNFTELGKGNLTTNNHLNDYDFVWVIEDEKLKIQTDWLYTINNEFEYKLDQNNNVLTLTHEGEEIKFVPLAN